MAALVPRGSSRERQKRISELVQAQGFSRIDDLAERFQVSSMTIHRDLGRLDDQGLIQKVRSGAKAQSTEAFERNVRFRQNHMLDQKQAVARAAMTWLEDIEAEVVSLDNSTTVLALGQLLVERLPMTVITNFLPVINLFACEPEARLIAVAGEYTADYDSFVGKSVIEAISKLQSDAHFMSATAVTKGGCYHPAEGEAAVKRAFMNSANRKVLLFDHTKLSRRALHLQASLSEFDAVIVDDGVSRDGLQMLRDSTRRVIVADREPRSQADCGSDAG